MCSKQSHVVGVADHAANLLNGGAVPHLIAHYAELAADRAYSLSAYPSAEKHYRLVLQYLGNLPDDAEQEKRLLAREQDPAKAWKLSAGDWHERQYWGDYTKAYEDALGATAAPNAPWYIIPANHKWYRNLVIGRLLLDHLRGMALRWPPADFDVDEQRRRLADEAPVG